MPQHNKSPRPPDGVGRQSIRSTPPAADGRRVDRLTVARRRASWFLLVVLAANVLVDVANVLVGGGRSVNVWLVGLTVVSAVGLVVGLVASRSGRRS